MPINWDSRALRYRGERGRFIRRDAVTRAVEVARTETKRRLIALGQQLKAGQINLPQFAIDVRAELKALHVLSAGIAVGGKNQLSPALLGHTGAQTRIQYEKFNAMLRQIASGEQPLDGTFFRRLRMYGDASRGTFSEVERRLYRNAGYEVEYNVPHAAEHCEGEGSCNAQTAKGKVPVGTLVPIGRRRCLTNCRCEIRYERAA